MSTNHQYIYIYIMARHTPGPNISFGTDLNFILFFEFFRDLELA